MAFKYRDKYLAYEKITSQTVGYASDMQTIFNKCQELSKEFDVPLKDFDLSCDSDGYGSSTWDITFQRPATSKEIEGIDAEEKRRKDWKRQQYEALKKEFE